METRETITVHVNGFRLLGTYHTPKSNNAGSRGRIAILFISAGVSPRAGLGDSAVYWADSLARRGHPTFRFDLPGLGESEGDLSSEAISLGSMVNDGVCGAVASEIANQLAERFRLPGLVILGSCSGAVNAIYAAAGNALIKGLILLDPYFNIQQDEAIPDAAVHAHSAVTQRLRDPRAHPAIRGAALTLLSCARTLYYGFGSAVRLVWRSKLPATANGPLIRGWNQLASTGVPVLVLCSPSLRARPGEFDYLGHLRGPSGGRVRVQSINGSTHSFVERCSKEGVLCYAQQWLDTWFPLAEPAAARYTEDRSPSIASDMGRIEANVR